jgi:hypothetical protein
MDELQRLIDEASPAPYVPGWSATRAQVALWRRSATEAVNRRCQARPIDVFPPAPGGRPKSPQKADSGMSTP